MSKSVLYTANLEVNEIPPVQGMTTKVVKGTFWSLIGQVLPFAVSLFATPFIIRMLGSEAYGVLILVGVITNYFLFADFGMSIASTKFGSEAFARGSKAEEAKVIRTAALIAFSSSFPIALGIFLFSFSIVLFLKIPEHLQSQASIALKLASVSFLFGILGRVFNTPQLSRLRMDLNTLVNSGFTLLGTIATPIVLYLGGGIAEAILVIAIVSFFILIGHVIVSGSLLKELFKMTIDKNLVKPLLKFGAAFVISSIAAMLLVNLEKGVLARTVSVEALAYYSVAFTFANMATVFSGAMIQSLLPAFSQLLSPENREQLKALFSRSIRVNLIGVLLGIMLLLVVAKPFFTIWAGEDFGRESSMPLYVLLVGLFFNIMAYIPHSLIIASGRTDILAKLYWIELGPYILTVALLTYLFGAVGAAMSWSLRVMADALILMWLAKKNVGVSFKVDNFNISKFAALVLTLLPPVLWAVFFDNFSIWLIALVLISAAIYVLLAWKIFITTEEKFWLKNKFNDLTAQRFNIVKR